MAPGPSCRTPPAGRKRSRLLSCQPCTPSSRSAAPAAGRMLGSGCSAPACAVRARRVAAAARPRASHAPAACRDACRSVAPQTSRIPRQGPPTADRRLPICQAGALDTTPAAPCHVGEDVPYQFCGGQAATEKPTLGQNGTATPPGAPGMPSKAPMSVGPRLACTDCTRKGGRTRGRYVLKGLSKA